MNYIYDILINFKPCLYDIYEWNKDDDILHLRKIPLFHLAKPTLEQLINYKVKVDSNFLSKIFNRTELFTRTKINTLTYCFLGTDGEEVIGFQMDNNGYITQYSKLLLEEEAEVLEYADHLSIYDLNHEVLSNRLPFNFKTRQEVKIKKYIDNEIDKILQDKAYDKLEYLYLDCFDKKKHKKDILNNIHQDIENNWDTIYLKLYQLLKITNK